MFLLAAYNIYAVSKDPYSGSRIFWDTDSELTLFPSGNYARIIQLQDGRIMAAAESGGGISDTIRCTRPDTIDRRYHTCRIQSSAIIPI